MPHPIGPRTKPRAVALRALAVAVLAGAIAPAAAAGAAGVDPSCTHDHAAPAPFAATPCPGVRPGAFAILSEAEVLKGVLPDGYCTLGFMVRGGGERFMLTSGHCAGIGELKEFKWSRGQGRPVFDRAGNRMGEFAYAALGEGLLRDTDIALVRLDRSVAASPEVCHFGGPSGINADVVPVTTPVTVEYYGNTFAGGHPPAAGQWLLPARTGLADGMPNARRISFAGHASFGDSGAPVMTADGRALGIISGPAAADADGHAGTTNAPRLPHQLARAEEVLGHKLTLVKAARD